MSRTSSVTPAEVGAGSAIIGAGIGYTLAPRKFNLEQLLTQKPDVFVKTLPEKVLNAGTEAHKTAYAAIVDARKAVVDASKKNLGEAKLAELVRAPKMENAYKVVKGFIPKARVQTAIVLGVIGGLIGVLARIIFGEKA